MGLTWHASRYTIDGNTVPRSSRSYNLGLIIHIDRVDLSTDRWKVTTSGLVYNHFTGAWDDDYGYRHADDKEPYIRTLAEVAALDEALINRLRAASGT
ncbi:hypothetical protein AB0C84_42785 [Actinomadura sp. NPDC048955]|uniref:hypothetical protein n=1 Tax=Actinomadura sp. NPDC048955 TaxID=3158228 RepID=UPI0034022A75